ncbi:MAG: GntR family transcriptional regulator [Gemmataceae bacterium]
MLFRIEPDSSIPIYEQIIAQVTFGVASGSLAVGGLIPSVRDLAERLMVHPNTVARAYQELEREGVLVSRRGRGMEVADQADNLCRKQRQEILRRRLRDVLREAVSSSLPVEDIRHLMNEELHRVNGQKK